MAIRGRLITRRAKRGLSGSEKKTRCRGRSTAGFMQAVEIEGEVEVEM